LTTAWSARVKPGRFIAGAVASLVAVLLIGEAVARLAMPQDIRDQMAPDAKQPRAYRADPQIGADFRSYEDFRKLNAPNLHRQGALDSPKPTWLLFGNSFVQGPKHLADTAEKALPDTRIFALRLHVNMPIWAAEARQLLSHGLRPQRIFFVLLPVDIAQIGKRPLSYIAVSDDGAIITRMRWPEQPWTSLVTGSRLATIAWIRSGRAAGDPGFSYRTLSDTPSPRVQDDLLRIFSHLGETSRKYGVPITVASVPSRDQIVGRSGFGLQEAIEKLSRQAGLDYLDARKPFVNDTDKASLFVPDWHFTDRGNALLLQELREHAAARAAKDPKGS
jgi:hypothetical protein